MKSSKIISKAIMAVLAFFVFISTATTSSAQTSTKKSSHNVSINMDGNRMSLKMNDDIFDLDMAYDFDATDVIAAVSNELGDPMLAGRYKVWEGEGYNIRIKDGSLDVLLKHDQVSNTITIKMQNILRELFKDLELDINIEN